MEIQRKWYVWLYDVMAQLKVMLSYQSLTAYTQTPSSAPTFMTPDSLTYFGTCKSSANKWWRVIGCSNKYATFSVYAINDLRDTAVTVSSMFCLGADLEFVLLLFKAALAVSLTVIATCLWSVLNILQLVHRFPLWSMRLGTCTTPRTAWRSFTCVSTATPSPTEIQQLRLHATA
jgi:hypothetical protein